MTKRNYDRREKQRGPVPGPFTGKTGGEIAGILASLLIVLIGVTGYISVDGVFETGIALSAVVVGFAAFALWWE